MTDLNSWQYLTTADLGPVETPPFVLRAGLTPTWDTWREGRFAERNDIFAGLWKSCVAWRDGVAKRELSPRKHLPVFWIEGQPGDGKSVLLLQLMAACLREQPALSIAWLEHSPDGAAFRNRSPVDSGWVFCAEIPTRVEGTVRDNWMSALQNAGATALVTSGSSEVRHGFEFHFGDCAKVTKFVLPPFNVSEAAHFAEWFQTRTEISRDATSLWRDGMSLTEFLFALHHGRPLAELTSDVRGALGNLGLGGRVRAVWLANALGLRAPSSLLITDAARNHAAKIAERGVVPVEADAAGLRLAPPGIAWPLTGTWLGERQQLQHLADALAFVLKAWLDAGDEENAVRFLRQLWGTEWLIDERFAGQGNRFLQSKHRDVLRELYRVHRRDFAGQPARATIPTWLEINEAFSLMLLPDPVVCATEIFTKPEHESRRTSLLAAVVWLAADSRRPPVGSDARTAVADYFLSPASGPGAGRALMRLVRDTKKLPEARTFAETWLKLLPDHSEAMEVLGALVKRAGIGTEFIAWVRQRFIQPKDSPAGTAKLLTALLEGQLHNEDMRRCASAWAWSHVLEPDTGSVWFTLLSGKLAKDDVIRGAWRWLAANLTHDDADKMRERLLVNYPQAEGAAWVMQEWMRNHSASEATPDLLLKLLETQPNNRKVEALALEWVNHSLTHPVSPKLLRVLAQHPNAAVQSVAGCWFDANSNSPSCCELLSVFIHIARGEARWVARGETYAENPRHPGREHIAASLLSAGGCQPRHVEMALLLLPELPAAPRTFLETALGRSLARHPLQAENVFRQFADTPHIPDLARALSRGLTQIADARVEFARRVLPAMDGEATFLTLCHLVRADICGSEIIQAVLNWLREHYRERGYTPLLGALHNHPNVWNCLLATTRLDKRVIADFQNYRHQTPEHFGAGITT